MQSTSLILTGLAVRIRDEYQAALQCANDAVGHAINAGMLLMDAKQSMPHGVFSKWIDENFDFTLRWAQQYMRIAENMALVEEAKANRGSLLSIRDVLRLIADERPKMEPKREGITIAAPAACKGTAQTMKVPAQRGKPLAELERQDGDEGETGLGGQSDAPVAEQSQADSPDTHQSPTPARRSSGLDDPDYEQHAPLSQMPIGFASLIENLKLTIGEARKTNWAKLSRSDARHQVKVLLALIDLL